MKQFLTTMLFCLLVIGITSTFASPALVLPQSKNKVKVTQNVTFNHAPVFIVSYANAFDERICEVSDKTYSNINYRVPPILNYIPKGNTARYRPFRPDKQYSNYKIQYSKALTRPVTPYKANRTRYLSSKSIYNI